MWPLPLSSPLPSSSSSPTAGTDPYSTSPTSRTRIGGGEGEGGGQQEQQHQQQQHSFSNLSLSKPSSFFLFTPTFRLLFLPLFLLLLLLPPLSIAYPSYLLDPEGCNDKKLEAGLPMMGSPITEEKSSRPTPITVYRGDIPLPSGSEYKSGETLSIKLEGRSGQYCMEVRGGPALFVDGACDGKRVTGTQTLALPMGEVGSNGTSTLEDISIHAGVSDHFGHVTLVKPFLLRAPTALGGSSSEAAFPPSLPPVSGSSIEEGGLELDPSLPLDPPPSLPRLSKAVVLDPESGMELSWTDGEGQEWVDVQIAARGSSWLAIGVISGKTQMVTVPPHEVLLFPDAEGEVSLVSLRAQSAEGVVPVPLKPQVFEVLFAQSSTESTILRYRHHAPPPPPPLPPTSLAGSLPPSLPPSSSSQLPHDLLLQHQSNASFPPPSPSHHRALLPSLLLPAGINTILWARGGREGAGAWPAMHAASGSVDVNWKADAGGAVTKAVQSHEPIMIPGVILLLLPLLFLPFTSSPSSAPSSLASSFRRSALGRLLLQRRLWKGMKGDSLVAKTITSAGAFRWGEVMVQAFVLLALIGLGVHWYLWGQALGWSQARAASVSSGLITITLLMLVTLPASKTGPWVRLCRLPFERAIVFHRALGHLTLVAASIHLGISIDQAPLLWRASPSSPVAAAFGLAAYICLCFVALSALNVVRRRAFDLFKALHYISAFSVYLLAFLHLPATIEGLPFYVPILYFSPPLFFFLIDRAYCSFKTWRSTKLMSLEAKEGGVTKLVVRVEAPLAHTQPGQYYLLSLPSLPPSLPSSTSSSLSTPSCPSFIETWHPYSACGDSDDTRKLHFLIKDRGPRTWSGRVRALAEQQRPPCPRVMVDGPYGRCSLSLPCYSHLLLLGGGVGITPLSSTLAWLRKRGRKGGKEGGVPLLKSVVLVWVVREVECLEWFDSWLAGMEREGGRAGGEKERREGGREEEEWSVGGWREGGGEGGGEWKDEDENGEESKNGMPLRSAVAAVAADAAATSVRAKFSPSLPPSFSFTLRLYVTGGREGGREEGRRGGVTEGGLVYDCGRPEVRTMVKKWSESREGGKEDGGEKGVVVCGPDAMLVEARNAVMELQEAKERIAMHEEVFHW
ncbi:hypothetical protein VYU27_008902 [Nannochloropsis oceanica]